MPSDFSTLADLESLCLDAVAEGLQIEFKTKEDASTATLSRGDKKAIAEAVSSFANSEGGTLILGVRTLRQGSADVATDLAPINDIDRYEANVRSVCSLNISPPLANIVLRVIRTEDPACGFLVCEVMRSESRPHMNTAPGVHSYFRRSFDGNVPMTPSEVRDQILAVREAVITPTAKLGRSASFSSVNNWIAVGFSIAFGIENTGTRACMNPFLRVRSSEPTSSNGANFDERLRMWKSNAAYGTLVHVDDAISFFNLSFVARVLLEKLWLGSTASENDLVQAVRLYPGTDALNSTTILDKDEFNRLSFNITYGAENAVARNGSLALDRDEIASRLLVQHEDHICERVIAQGMSWRSDLVANLKTRLGEIDIQL